MNYFSASLMLYSNYYPFGMLMPNRHGQDDDYRFGFNGKESDKEIYGSKGSSYDFGARMYDSRIARFNSRDPMSSVFAYNSPYSFAGNTPIWAIDYNGMCRIKIFGLKFGPIKKTAIVNGRTFKYKFSSRNSQKFKVKEEGSWFYRRVSFKSKDKERRKRWRKAGNRGKPTSLGLLVSLTSGEINEDDVDYKNLNREYHGIPMNTLITQVVDQNSDIELTIIGNHSITTSNYITPNGEVTQWEAGTLTYNGRHIPNPNAIPNFERDFTRQRAETVKSDVFNSNNSRIVTMSRWDIPDGQTHYDGVKLQDKRKDSRGITITIKVNESEPYEREVHPYLL